MGPKSLDPFFTPRSVAVVGASRNPAAFGNLAIANLQHYGFSGHIFPIHLTEPQINGLPAFRSIVELPETPDLCILAVRAELAIELVGECIGRGVKAVTMVGSGFAESGLDEGIIRQRQLIALASDAGTLILGPNTLGAAGFTSGAVSLASANVPTKLTVGGVGIVSQSGGLGTTILSTAQRYGLGVSYFVGVGNEADISTSDVIAYYVEQRISVILCYIETIRDVGAFRDAAQLASEAGIRIVLLKGGTEPGGQKVTAAHTASLAGSTRVLDAALQNWGISRVSSIEALVASGVLIERFGVPTGRRCGIMGIGGGIAALLADAAESNGLHLASIGEETSSAIREILPDSSASNPLDPGGWFLGNGGAEALREALDHFAADDGIDLVLHGMLPLAPVREAVYVEGIAASAATRSKPSLCLSFHSPETSFRRKRFAESNIVELPCTEAATEALRVWLGNPEFDNEMSGDLIAPASAPVRAMSEESRYLRPGETKVLLEDAAIELLRELGLSFPHTEVVATPEQARKESASVGFPVVIKALADGLVHRARVGAVAVGVENSEAAEMAAARVVESARRVYPDAEVRLLIQRQVGSGTEMIVGVQNDPVFGHVVLLGLGGVLSEALDDVAFVFPPVTPEAVTRALRELRTSTYLEQLAKSGSFSEDALVELIIAVGRVIEAIGPALDSIDLNPVIVSSHEAVIVDALVVLRGTA